MTTGKEERKAYLAAFAAVPGDYVADQAFTAEFMKKHFGPRLTPRSLGLLRTVLGHPSIRKRHFAFQDPAVIVDEDPDRRIGRFTEQSVALAGRAAERALAAAGVAASEVTGIVVNTCTGYICPGISTYLVERLGLARTIRAYDMVGSGCGGAIPNLQAAETMVRAGGGVVLSVSVEICSATFQMDNDVSLILSNALFGDGAAAAVVSARRGGWELAASAARYAPELRDSIRYVHKNGQLHNQLSLKLPGLVGKAAKDVVTDLLAERNLPVPAVHHWALHTGGEKILDAVRDGIGIADGALAAARTVLAEYGNMSSPTVWFVLDEIRRTANVAADDWCVMLAYGAGLSAHAYLLRKV